MDWFSAMRSGDFAAAWRISDRILAERGPSGSNASLPRHQQAIWSGRDLHGQRVLVRCYHGLGDTLQFARFLPLLQRIAADVTVWVQPPLIPLLERADGVGRLIALNDGEPMVDYDVDIEIMELAHAFRTAVATIPKPLQIDIPPAPKISNRYSVGVVAQSGDWDQHRSIPDDEFRLDVRDVDLFSLQLEAPIAGMTDASTHDIVALASRLRSLDLVITVDTMMAHLAATIGVPTWVLLALDADWRWMKDRADSPWYPTMRLFRQSVRGAWRPVINQVNSALATARGASGTRTAGYLP